MKKIILLFILVMVSCKNENKQITDSKQNKSDAPKEVITTVNLSLFPAWGTVGVEIKDTGDMYLTQGVYLMSRNDKFTKSTYAHSRKVFIDYENLYRASVIVKKAENGSLFGLRIMGSYPDRVDAVFNLDDGSVKGVQKTRDFESESAKIEALGDGWFKCSVSAVVVADEVNIFLGPTSGNEKVDAWTIRNPNICDVLVLPLSLTLEKISVE